MRARSWCMVLGLVVACSGGVSGAPPALVTIGTPRPTTRRSSSRSNDNVTTVIAHETRRHDEGGEAGRLYQEGLAAAGRNDFPTAAQRFGRAYELAPSLEMAFNAFRMCQRAANVDDATRWYERALTHSPPAQVRAELDQGMASLRGFAARRREDIARLPPDNDVLQREAASFFNRGVAQYAHRRYRAALEAFEAALHFAQQGHHEVAELYFNLAVTHEHLGHRAEAVAAFREYLSRRPDSPDRASVEARIRTLSQ